MLSKTYNAVWDWIPLMHTNLVPIGGSVFRDPISFNKIELSQQVKELNSILGGLSLQLNYLTVSCLAIFNWPFRTLSFGILLSNLDIRELKTYPKTYFGNF